MISPNKTMDSSNDIKVDQPFSNFKQHENPNIDLCFQLIFPYLDVSDLVSVAESCKEMKTIAELTFYEEYGKTCCFILDPNRSSSNQITYQFNQKNILDSKRCFGFLRCFGHMIFNLKPNYDHCSLLLSSQMNEYIIKYCTSINQIEILSIIRRSSADSLIGLLDNCKSLRKLIFAPLNTTDYKKFIQLLNKRRNISMKIDEDCEFLKIICYK